jgi:photosystem II stability/assembly factor-like uncharacterized protein
MKRLLPLILILASLDLAAQNNWTNTYAPHSRHLNSVSVVDYFHVCIVGGNQHYDSLQTILTTQDTGINWDVMSDHLAPWLMSVDFSDVDHGLAVGDYGTVLQTTNAGVSWSPITLPGSMGSRHYNAVFYTDSLNAYAVGGNRYNDSIATIIKSTDGGASWSVSKDNLGYWFTAVHFPTTNVGYAVGDHGTIFKTTDAGSTWTQKTVPGNAGLRNYSAVYFMSSTTGIVVGGNLINDSIQTILKTTDGGDTWSIIRDSLAPMLNDVFFLSANVGYAVGNNGTVISTGDGGDSWQNVNVPGNSSIYDFNAVRFYDATYGYIVGDWGIIFRYSTGAFTGPYATTFPPDNVNPSGLNLSGMVNANSHTTNVYFQYGLTDSYGSAIAAVPALVSGNSNIAVYATLQFSTLVPNSLYHYRIVADNVIGSAYGDDEVFYSGMPEIPNFNFEFWDSTVYQKPDLWNFSLGLVDKMAVPCHGNFAVKLRNDTVTNNPGVIMIGNSDNGSSFYGGAPFTARPDSLKACLNYTISPGDTALIVMILKDQGNIVSNNLFKIFGSSGGSFVEQAFPLQYLLPDTPDSLIIGIVCTDSRNLLHPLSADNVLIADYLRLSGTAQTLPNYDFEDWTSTSLYDLISWYNGYNGPYNTDTLHRPVKRTTDAISGQYAVKLQTYMTPTDTLTGRISVGDGPFSKFAVSARHEALNGYFKYSPENGDTMSIVIQMFAGGVPVGWGTYSTNATIPGYTAFMADIVYGSPSDIPDSASLSIQTYKNKPQGNSVLIVDNISFDGLLAYMEEDPYVQAQAVDMDLRVFPNPMSSMATIEFTLGVCEEVNVRLFDISGRPCMVVANGTFEEGKHQLVLDASGLSDGFYFCVVNAGTEQHTFKIIVNR